MTRFLLFTPIFLMIFMANTASAFDSGSTGTDGAFNPTADVEVQLPPDGILNYTTVDIPADVTVTFALNDANTPVYLLATGDVTIAGVISIKGTDATDNLYPVRGGPGGFDGGRGGNFGMPGGKGLGTGGGNPGSIYSSRGYGGGGGGFGSDGAVAGNSVYGGSGGIKYGNSKILPVIGGSGGGGGAGSNSSANVTKGGDGGGGGGAILIASSGAITVIGSITADGGDGGDTSGTYAGSGGGGSGGAIKLMANTIAGSGTVSAGGGARGSGGNLGGAGGTGWVRFEADAITLTGSATPPGSYGYPGDVFVANTPTLTITSIAGVDVPAGPSGRYETPDLSLPSTTENPVTINIAATNIPIGTLVTVTSVPAYGDATNATGAGLAGTEALSTTSVSITLSTTYRCILLAQATFAIQTAMFYDGEMIDKVRVAATMDGESEVVYITKSGREIKSSDLKAKPII